MRFLVDNALSPALARALSAAGEDAIHVRDIDMGAAKDRDILSRAAFEDRIVVSEDLDFGTLLAASGNTKPSCFLFRSPFDLDSKGQAAVILANLPTLAHALLEGAIVVFNGKRVRVRNLPIMGKEKDE